VYPALCSRRYSPAVDWLLEQQVFADLPELDQLTGNVK
jgi:hypothetical protein